MEPPACAAPRLPRRLRPARRLVATAVRRPQPAVTALCACALGPGRREPPVGCGSAASPSAAPVSARQRLAAQRRVREGAGKGGGSGATGRGGAGGRATPGEAKRSPGNRGEGGGGGGQRRRLSGARLSARPPASPRRRNPQHRPPVRPHPPAVPESRGLIAHPPASSPRGAHVRIAPRRLLQPLCEVEPIVRCPGHACLLATPLRPTQCRRPENLSSRP